MQQQTSGKWRGDIYFLGDGTGYRDEMGCTYIMTAIYNNNNINNNNLLQ